MPSHSAVERQMIARIASHVSWAYTEDRTARTAPARAAMDARFLEQAGGDPVRAESLRKAYFLQLARKSADARRRKAEADKLRAIAAEATAAAEQLEAGDVA